MGLRNLGGIRGGWKVCALASLLAPLSASATDLTLGLGAFVDYDTNVFRTTENEEDDVLFKLLPSIKIHEDRGQDFNYHARYRMPVEFSVNNSQELNDIDHFGDVGVSYHPTDRIEIFLRDDVRSQRSILRTDIALDVNDVPIVSQNRDRIITNDLRLGGSYIMSPRLTAFGSVGHRLFETSRDDRQDNWSANALGNVQYALSARNRVGVGAQYLHQDFEQSTIVPGSTSDSVNVFASWEWRITETLALELRAGPAVVVIDEELPGSQTITQAVPSAVVTPSTGANDGVVRVSSLPTCPVVSGVPVLQGCALVDLAVTDAEFAALTTGVASMPTTLSTLGSPTSDTSVDVFAEAGITKRWTEYFNTGARYSRSQGTASGVGGSVIRDTVTVSADWTPFERVRLVVRGDWVRRESVSDLTQIFIVAQDGQVIDPAVPANVAGALTQAILSTGSSRVDTNRWSGRARLAYQLFRNTTVSGVVRYDNQDSNGGTLGSGSDFDNWTVSFGVTHQLDPIKLW